MDINSLLSPQDSPAQETPPRSPSLQASGKRAARQIPSRTPSGLSQQITSSPQPPLSYQQQPPPQQQQQQQQQLPSPGVAFTNGNRGVHSATSTPSDRPIHSPRDARMTPPNPLLRQASTPGMDALAGGCRTMPHVRPAMKQGWTCGFDTMKARS